MFVASFILAILAGLVTLASTAPSLPPSSNELSGPPILFRHELHPQALNQDTPLELEIQLSGNSAIKAKLTNVGSEDLKLLRPGSILDDSYIEKAEVHSISARISSTAVHPFLKISSWIDDDFEILPAGVTVDLEWDIANTHDLSAGGTYSVTSRGIIEYANLNSTIIAGALHFKSNEVTANVDGRAAGEKHRRFIEVFKRATVINSCQGDQLNTIFAALDLARQQAELAATAAASGSADRMNVFFKSADPTTRQIVADTFSRIASECRTDAAGVSKFHCNDPWGYCSNNWLAYAYGNEIVHCPIYWNMQLTETTQCDAQTKANTAIHEISHIGAISGTSDLESCYGIQCIRGQSRENNLKHADTYTLFAQYSVVNCYP